MIQRLEVEALLHMVADAAIRLGLPRRHEVPSLCPFFMWQKGRGRRSQGEKERKGKGGRASSKEPESCEWKRTNFCVEAGMNNPFDFILNF